MSLHKFLAYLAGTIVLATMIKIAALVFTTPLYGYANNFDFIRQSSCTSVWQNYPDGKNKTFNNPEAPVNSLKYDGDFNPLGCAFSLDNVFLYIARAQYNLGDVFTFEKVATPKFIFLFLGLLATFLTVRSRGRWLTSAFVFALVFGDLSNILYINTLYSEFGTLVCLYVVTFIFNEILVAEDKPNKTQLILISVFLILLGIGKQQYGPLAFLFSLAFGALYYSKFKKILVPALITLVSLSSIVAFNMMNRHLNTLQYVYKTDTFLWAVLPEASDKKRALEILKLPEQCLEGIGKSWYDPGVADNHPCPMVESAKRTDLIALFAVDPGTFFKPLWQATLRFYPGVINTGLGHLETPALAEHTRYKITKATSLTTAFPYVSAMTLACTIWASFIISGIIGIYFIAKQKRPVVQYLKPTGFLIFFGGFMAFYSLGSSVFGDGYAEMAKHAYLTNFGLSLQLAGLISALVYFLYDFLRRKTSKAKDS